jgi:2',3'-cyclic-nucleotide 2'-phosphodiesterase (5'-nucleotidase family)
VKAAHPSAVILLAHAGGSCEASCSGEIIELAKQLPAGAVDLIVAGHTHTKIATEVNGIPIVEARSSGAALGVVDLVRRPAGGFRAYIDVRTTYADQVTPDSALGELTYQLTKQVTPLARRRIADLAQPLTYQGDTGEFPLGDFVANAQRNLLRADIAVMNTGGIRSSIAAGEVTYDELFAVQPFGNRIVVLLLSGAEVRQVLEHVLETGAPTAHASGIVVTWDSTKPPGKRVVEVMLPGKRKLGDADTYRVAVNDFLAAGSDGYTMLIGKPQERGAMGDVEVLELYLKRLPQPAPAPATGVFIQKRK